MARGKPFEKGNQAAKNGNGGRPAKSREWKKAEDVLRATLPRLLLMKKSKMQQLLAEDPTNAEIIALEYIHKYPVECVNRFLGKVPDEIHQENTGDMHITFNPGTD